MMSQFLHAAAQDDNDDAKAIAIPRVFSENSQAKKFFPDRVDNIWETSKNAK